MVKLADMLKEVAALEDAMTKSASSKKASRSSSLASALDKIAESVEDDKEKKDDEKDEDKEHEDKETFPFEAGEKEEEKENKEAMLNSKDIQKIASEVVRQLSKIAVADTPETQSVALQAAPSGGVGGGATEAARKEDQLIPGTEVENKAKANPNAMNPASNDGVADLIVDAPPQSDGVQNALGGIGAKQASVIYTADEAQTLQKLASVGYEYLVDYYSDKIVQEKVASAVLAERAKDAPEKIARAIIAQEKTAAAKDTTGEKLAHIKKTDPALFGALQVLANRNLI